jgi:hypothetical protein
VGLVELAGFVELAGLPSRCVVVVVLAIGLVSNVNSVNIR